jgi:D-alanyl-D-alanine carboxypeptidase/D-alanyl-D-alanine-endopeptidase (penicillin-binding protein 4)
MSVRASRLVVATAAALLLTACAARKPDPPSARPASQPPAVPRVVPAPVPAVEAATPPDAPRAVPAPPAGVPSLAADVDALLDRPGHQRATWGIAVRSLRTGEHLYARNAGALLVPGSVMKVATATAAAAAMGWDFTFTTTAEAAGPIEAGVLKGDLVLKGTGDPSTLSDGGPDLAAALVDALRQRGVRRVEGRVIADDSAVEEPRPGLAWSWDDLGTATGALSGALNATDNVTRVTVVPGAGPGAPVRIDLPPDDPDMAIANRAGTGPPGSPQTLWAERRPGEAALTIAGSLASDARPAPLTVAVENPTLWTARIVRRRLIAAGIAVDGIALDADGLPAVPAGERLVSLSSRPLRELVRPMLKRSINVWAEAIVRLAAGPDGLREMSAAGTAIRGRLRDWGAGEYGVRMVDGSGLSRFNLASADALAGILAAAWAGGASPLVEALPVAGADGTLAERMKGTAAAGNVRAKTGTMTHVRSLAGYVTTADGEPLTFAVIVNNFEGPPAGVIATIDAIATRLATLRR